ncbi:hypothetical protein FRC12_024447 [Ceratobasidium sp. 428]|nr:hypothetical protein FRC12_024447 [Ceratobasidium sp. 428]
MFAYNFARTHADDDVSQLYLGHTNGVGMAPPPVPPPVIISIIYKPNKLPERLWRASSIYGGAVLEAYHCIQGVESLKTAMTGVLTTCPVRRCNQTTLRTVLSEVLGKLADSAE